MASSWSVLKPESASAAFDAMAQQQPLVYFPANPHTTSGLEGYFYPQAAVDPFQAPFLQTSIDMKESPSAVPLASPSSTSSSSCSNYSMMMVPQPQMGQQPQPHLTGFQNSPGFYNCGPASVSATAAAAAAEVRLPFVNPRRVAKKGGALISKKKMDEIS